MTDATKELIAEVRECKDIDISTYIAEELADALERVSAERDAIRETSVNNCQLKQAAL